MAQPLRKHRAVLCAVCALLLALALSGCNPSDTITQIIYDQNPENEVDASQTLLVNDPLAERTSDTLPKLVEGDVQENAQDYVANMPRYGGDTSQALVALPVEAPTEEDQDVESDQVGEDSSEHRASGSEGERERGSKSREGSGSGSEGDDADDAPDAPLDDGDEKREGGDDPGALFDDEEDGAGDDPGDDGENPENQGDNQSDIGKGKNADNDVKVYKDYGDTPEIPEDIHRVTAVGQAAVIVSMLGGTPEDTPLVGADAELLDNPEVQAVLAGKGIAGVKRVWENDGSSEGDLLDVQDVIDLDPELCFVMEGDDTFTEEQENELLAANIIVYVIPSMASPSKIKFAVQLVGDILSEGGNEQAGSIAERYARFHDEVIADIAGRNNGVTGGFDYDTGRDVATGADPLYSLYISDWDYDARYEDDSGYLDSPDGVGVADVGYERHPISYYMSVGGVSNTAAMGTFRVLSGYRAPVWQFSLTQAPCTWDNWRKINREKVSYELKGNGFSYALLWADVGEGYGLGTEEFPGVIVATQEMRDAMLREALEPKGIYYPYPATTSTKGGVANLTMVGFYNGENLVAASIGTSGDGIASILNDGKGKVGSYRVEVNPHGLFCDWAGGSVESVLESAWVYKTFRDGGYDIESLVTRFYRDFYGYELGSRVSSVLEGREG